MFGHINCILRLLGIKHRKLYSVNLFWRYFHERVVEWIIDFLPNLIELQLGTNNGPFQADLVLYEWVVETYLEFSLKSEKEYLLRQLFMKIHLSTNMKIY